MSTLNGGASCVSIITLASAFYDAGIYELRHGFGDCPQVPPIRSTIGSSKRPRARTTTVSCSRGRILAPDLLTHSGWGISGPSKYPTPPSEHIPLERRCAFPQPRGLIARQRPRGPEAETRLHSHFARRREGPFYYLSLSLLLGASCSTRHQFTDCWSLHRAGDKLNSRLNARLNASPVP